MKNIILPLLILLSSCEDRFRVGDESFKVKHRQGYHVIVTYDGTNAVDSNYCNPNPQCDGCINAGYFLGVDTAYWGELESIDTALVYRNNPY